MNFFYSLYYKESVFSNKQLIYLERMQYTLNQRNVHKGRKLIQGKNNFFPKWVFVFGRHYLAVEYKTMYCTCKVCQANKEDIKSSLVSPKKTNDSMKQARNAQKNAVRIAAKHQGDGNLAKEGCIIMPYRVGRENQFGFLRPFTNRTTTQETDTGSCNWNLDLQH